MIRLQPRKPLWRQLLARLLKLPPINNGVVVHKDVAIPMSDGEMLHAHHFVPRGDGEYPTILIRSPWGRGWDTAPFSFLYRYVAQRFAERGYHVLLQDTHKRPWRDATHATSHFYEPQDGRDTLYWLVTQPWFNGKLGMWGASYLGYTQWAALAADLPELKKLALFPVTTATNWSSVMHPDDVPALDTIFRLQYLTGMPNGSLLKRIQHLKQQEKVIAAATSTTPVMDAAQSLPIAAGISFTEILRQHDVHTPFWQAIDLSGTLPKVDAAVHLTAGWYDIFLREQLADYHTLRTAGKTPYLTIGPWHHTDQAIGNHALHNALTWFDGHLHERAARLPGKPVCLFIMGCDAWREFDQWPPLAAPQNYYLRAEKHLGETAPQSQEEPDQYSYDPADPTPTIGGAVLNPTAGRQDNQALEARDDILCYTTDILAADLEVIGEPELVLFVTSSLDHTDFFGRICDVFPDGRSMNVTDGFTRLAPSKIEPHAGGILKVTLKLWPTAYCFVQGNRLRLQVASGAHPRWHRNLGTGESQLESTQMVVAHQTVYHDEAHPSHLKLPLHKT